MEIESWTQICAADKQYRVPRAQQVNREHPFSLALDEPNAKSSRSVKSSLVLIIAKTVDCRSVYELGARFFRGFLSHYPASNTKSSSLVISIIPASCPPENVYDFTAIHNCSKCLAQFCSKYYSDGGVSSLLSGS